MLEINSTKIININSKSLSEIKKLNLQKLGLKKIQDSNFFEYNSNVFKVLSYKIRTKIIFAIFFKENNIYIELQKITGIPKFIQKNITLSIKVDIYQEREFCRANRFISLIFNKDSFFLKFLSDENANKLLLLTLETISKRFDKKFFNKIQCS